MAKKLIILDDGHGMKTAGKRTPTVDGKYMPENEFNRAVVKYLKVELERNGFDTYEVAPTDEDTPLGTRTSLANAKDGDLYLSIHANANTGVFGSWGGIETFVYPNSESKRIGAICHAELLKGSKLSDRGVKNGSHLWVIKKTEMPAILFELGFMDSHNDYKYLITDAYRKECAVEIALGVCKAFGVVYKAEVKPEPVKATTSDSGTFYRVVTGSFKDRESAEQRMKDLKASGFDSFVIPYKK